MKISICFRSILLSHFKAKWKRTCLEFDSLPLTRNELPQHYDKISGSPHHTEILLVARLLISFSRWIDSTVSYFLFVSTASNIMSSIGYVLTNVYWLKRGYLYRFFKINIFWILYSLIYSWVHIRIIKFPKSYNDTKIGHFQIYQKTMSENTLTLLYITVQEQY